MSAIDESNELLALLRAKGRGAEADALEKKRDETIAAAVSKVDAEHAAEIAKLKAGPKREAVLRRLGVDVAAINEQPAIVEVLERQVPPDGDAEAEDQWGRDLIEKYRLPVRGVPASHWGGNWANGQV